MGFHHVIYTIGYEGLTLGEFTDILQAHAIDVLVDVRELPLSRKKGFSKSSLGTGVESSGIHYIHLRDLGAPRKIRHNLRDNGDWSTYRRAYLKTLEGKKITMELLCKLAKTFRACLMCFEEDYSICHRSLIAEKIQDRGAIKKIKHLHAKKEKVVIV